MTDATDDPTLNPTQRDALMGALVLARNASDSAASAAEQVTLAQTAANNAAATEVAIVNLKAAIDGAVATFTDDFEDFNARYLGAFNTDPTVDGNGDALVNGALYFNTIYRRLIVFQSGTWYTSTNTVLSTTGAPSNSVGFDNDFALDVANHILYGPKAAGTWPAGVSFQGPQGIQGPSGAGSGSVNPTGTPFVVGKIPKYTTTDGTVIGDSGMSISGAYTLAWTIGANTALTLPASGTLATLAGSEALTNKTYNGNTWTSGTGTLTIAAGKTLTVSNTITIAATDATSLDFKGGANVNAFSALTGAANKIPAFTGAGTMANVTYGTSGANALLQLDGSGALPSLDGSALTGVQSGSVGDLLVTARTPAASYLLCDGSAYSQSSYASLYALIGQDFANIASFSSPTANASTNGLLCSVYSSANSLFIAAGAAGTMVTSPDGSTWTSRTSTLSGTIKWLINTGSLLVAVDDAGGVATSTNGTTWTNRGTPLAANPSTPTDVIYSSALGLFIATHLATASPGGISTSSDAITWTARTTPFSGSTEWGVNLACNSTVIVASGPNAGLFATSPDGINWTRRTTAPWTVGSLGALYYNAALGKLYAQSSVHYTSSDGINWTALTRFDFPQGMSSTLPAYFGKIGSLYLYTASDATNRSAGVLWATKDWVSWRPMTITTMPNNTGTPLRSVSASSSALVVARTPSSDQIALLTFDNTPASDFRVPVIYPEVHNGVRTYIKAS